MGHWHFHGFLAVRPEFAERVWTNGALNRHLKRDLDSFSVAGAYRAAKVNKYLIEPVAAGIENWASYIHKQQRVLT